MKAIAIVAEPQANPADMQTLAVMHTQQDACAALAGHLRSGTGPATGNQSLPSIIRPLTDSDLAFPQRTPFGHCHALYTRKGQGGAVVETLKLLEGGANNDSPRTNMLQGVDGKVYIYHVLAKAEAELNPTEYLNLEILGRVSAKKEEDNAWTILHLCGHKWCMNAQHFAVGTKRHNEEQTSCHRGLQSTNTEIEYATVQSAYCRHSVKCWSVVYAGDSSDGHQWA